MQHQQVALFSLVTDRPFPNLNCFYKLNTLVHSLIIHKTF